jgi:uncharacterized protein YjiS (DUF1127 family)
MLEFVGWAATAGRYIASVWRAAVERKARNMFLHMDERLLRDVGLTREDVADSFATQMEPFEFLMARRNGRRVESIAPRLDRAANEAATQDKKPPVSLAA